MHHRNIVRRRSACLALAAFLGLALGWSVARAETNLVVRIMAANLTGNSQVYGTSQIRILQGLKPDVVALQEFQYGDNSDTQLRSFVDTAFGTNFLFYREPGYSIPNGIISRYPIRASGSWLDTEQSQPNRGFAWAQVALPGTNDLYVVSVHLLSSAGSSARAAEAANLRTLIEGNFPTNAFVVVAGDLNTDSRSESAVTTFKKFLSDSPIPTDAESGGNQDTNEPRNKPYDYVLPSPALASRQVGAAFASHTFPSGLVFDSRLYTPLSDVAPVQLSDSAAGQHMAVLKDFQISVTETNLGPIAPWITAQPQSRTVAPGENAAFSIAATGTAPLSYQWRHAGTNLAGAVAASYSRTNVQAAAAGAYSVVVSNSAGSVISSNAWLTVAATAPTIATPPQSQSILAGQSVIFTVTAAGTAPLAYQWRWNATNLPGATADSFTLTNAQLAAAGSYSVVVTNSVGSVTSAPAILSVGTLLPAVIAQWNFNSVPPDGVTTSGSTAPSVGAGTASLVGGVTGAFATGDPALDPAGATDNSAWNTTTYPASGAANKTAGVKFSVSTAGRQNLSVSWSEKASSTGGKYVRLQFSTNGTTFQDFPTFATVSSSGFTARTNSLAAFPAVNENPSFAFRIVAEFESTATGSGTAGYVAAGGGTYATSGTVRFDMVTLSGTTIPIAPPTAAVLGAPTLEAGRVLRFTVTGQAGADYIVQAATNLSDAWWPVHTNRSPFTFAETNSAPLSQRYYRVLAAPWP
jgi:endonuclease/exonuclease/phosphatase family metal-dependent hydrolase